MLDLVYGQELFGLQFMVVIFGVISVSMTVVFFLQMKKRNIILEEPATSAVEAN